MNKTTINDALRLMRLYWGDSQAEVAKRTGLPQSLISEIESKKKNVTIDVLEKYSVGFRIRISELLFFAEEIDGQDFPGRGRLIIADRVISLLDRIRPRENTEAAAG